MPEPEITYYVLISKNHPPERPAGLVRRIHTESMPTDQELRRDLQWHPTQYLRRYWLGHNDSEHVQITEEEVEQILPAGETWSASHGPGALAVERRGNASACAGGL